MAFARQPLLQRMPFPVGGRPSIRRRMAGRALLATVPIAVAALCWRGSRCLTTFVGQAGTAPPQHGVGLALRATKEKRPGAGFSGDGKQKQRLSLKEALERQKSKQQEQIEKKEDAKLAPEMTFFEGPPSSTEVLFPFLSCFLVIGVIPFISAVNRQFRVKYKITDRRVSVNTGWDGKDVTEFSYQEIYEMKYGLRFFGYCGDMRISLRDGAKVELFGLLNFEDNYNFIIDRCDKDAVKRSDPRPQDLD